MFCDWAAAAAARACRLPPSVSRLCSASISHAFLTTSVEGLFPILIVSTTGSEVVFDLGVGLVAENRWFERRRGAGVVQSWLKDVVFVSLAFSRRSISNSHSFLIMRLPHVTPSGGSSVVKSKLSSCFKSFREPFTSSKVTWVSETSNSRRLGKDASENSVGGNESFPISAFSNLSLFNLFSKAKLRKSD